jgi:hypothetical protein
MEREYNRFLLVFHGLNGNVRPVIPFLCELHGTIDHGEKRVVLANANILARVVYGATLPDQDVPGFHNLPSKKLDSQSFALRVTTVS